MCDVTPLPGLPLETARLRLRQAVADDAAAVWAFRRLPEVAEWITAAPHDAEAFAAHFAEPDRLATTLVVERLDDGAGVGDLMLRVGDSWSQAEVREGAVGTEAEVGYVLDPAHQGHGYGTEAVRALVGHAFGVLGVRWVVAACFADNEASWRLMERLGMRREQHGVGDSLHRTRGWLDGLTYAVLDTEWPAAP
ncbi:MAG: GNAT family N-acetyltransferase [Nocardioides sp.]|nr:GNAT family N-acetyltransferase [Nocardioides sp.]